MFKRIDHVEVVPRDPEVTLQFYVDVLGFTVTRRVPVTMPPMKEVIYLQLGDTVVELISADDPQPKSDAPWQVGYRGLALEVEDMAQAVAYLARRGVPMHRDPVDLGSSLRAEILDPDELLIELRQWK